MVEHGQQIAPQPAYSSALSGKAALLEETLAALRQINQGHTPEAVKAMVVEEDLLGKTSRATRESVWNEIQARYLVDEGHARLLARMVVQAPDRQTERLVLFYEMCRAMPILHDTTIHCVYPRYASGYSAIDKTDIQRYFDTIAPEHPELEEWSPQTRYKVVSNILTALRDFGLLEGVQRKQFTRLFVPLPAFVYVFYRLAQDGLTAAKDVLDTDEWRLFFLEQPDVLSLLEEASAAGHCTFKQRGDIYSLELHYPSLEACVDALIR